MESVCWDDEEHSNASDVVDGLRNWARGLDHLDGGYKSLKSHKRSSRLKISLDSGMEKDTFVTKSLIHGDKGLLVRLRTTTSSC